MLVCARLSGTFLQKLRSKKKKKKPLAIFFLFLTLRRPLLLNRSSAFLRYFGLNQSSGVLTIKPNTPAGSYWLRVGVSDGVWPDVFSGVRVHVRELEEKSILLSASLRLTGNVTTSWHNTILSLTGFFFLVGSSVSVVLLQLENTSFCCRCFAILF